MLPTPFFKASIPLLRDKSLRLTYQARWILLYLYDRQEMKNWPVAHSVIGKDLGGMPVMKVRRIIEELKAKGFVEVTGRKSAGMVYTVSLVSVHSDQSQDAQKPHQNPVSDHSEQSRVFTVNNISDKDTLNDLLANKNFLKDMEIKHSETCTNKPVQNTETCGVSESVSEPRDSETLNVSLCEGSEHTEKDVKKKIHLIPMRDIAKALGEFISDDGCITCPWHNDTNPSLLVGTKHEQRERVYCRAGCETQDGIALVQARLGLTFPQALEWFYKKMGIKRPTKNAKQNVLPDAAALKILKDHGITTEEVKRRSDFFYSAQYGGSWAWVLDKGKVYRAVNPKLIKGKEQRYFNGTKGHGTPMCFYKTGDPNTDTIILAGGMFDAMNVNMKTQLEAWSSNCGEGSLPKDYQEQMKNIKTVIMLYDNDEAGIRGATRVTDKLKEMDITVKFVHLPPQYKDVSEYFAAGHTAEEFKTLLQHIQDVQNTKSYKPIQRTPIDELMEWAAANNRL